MPGDHPSNYGPGPALLSFSDRANTDELTPYSVYDDEVKKFSEMRVNMIK